MSSTRLQQAGMAWHAARHVAMAQSLGKGLGKAGMKGWAWQEGWGQMPMSGVQSVCPSMPSMPNNNPDDP